MDRNSLIAGVALILLVIGVMAYFLANSSRKDAPGVSGNAPSLFNPQDFNSMVEDLEEQTGSATVFTASLFPEYAVLGIPVEASGRYESLVWRGEFSESSKGTTDTRRFDLRKVNPDALQTLLDDASRHLDLIDSRSINIAGADAGYPFPRMIATVSNEYGESSTVVARLNGKIIQRSQ